MGEDNSNLARHIVEGWDMDTLIQYAETNVEQWLDTLSDEELELEKSDCGWEDD